MGYERNRRRTLLTASQEVALAQLIEAGRSAQTRIDAGKPAPGDEDRVTARLSAQRDLIEANIGLAIHMAHKAPAPAHVDRQDMAQDALCGLGRAVEGFNWRRGNRFCTYAGWWIRQAIQQGLETAAAPVRIPTHASQDLFGALRAVDGDHRQLPAKLTATLAMTSMASLDRTNPATGHALSMRVPAQAADPADVVTRQVEAGAAANLLAGLDPTTRHALSRRFGLGGTDPATFAEIGAELGVSAEAARRRIHRTLDRLRPVATTLAA